MKSVHVEENARFRMELKLAPDKMKLFLDLKPLAADAKVALDELVAIIAKASSLPPDLQVLDDIVLNFNKGVKSEGRRIAKGLEAIPGENGKLLLLVKKYTGKGEITSNDKGEANLTEMHLFDNVKKDQLVARIYAPRPGTDGRNALGEVIKAPLGKPAKFKHDKTVKIGKEAEHEVLLAVEEGYLVEEQGSLAVKSELVIKGNLDFRYGNIDFIGKVIVQGDVLPRFKLKAKGGIEVKGMVNGGTLICTDGDIIVHEGVIGSEGGQILALKNFTAKVTQQANIESLGIVQIKKEARDSVIRTTQYLTAPEGVLVGGKTYAICGVEAKDIGSQAGKDTHLFLCSDVEASSEFGQIELNIQSHQKAAGLIKLHLGPLAENPARIKLLNKPHREKMEALYTKLQAIESSKDKLVEKKTELLAGAHYSSVQRVNFTGWLFEGVSVHAGEEVFRPNESVKGPKSLDFVTAEKKFTVADLKALECRIDDNKTPSQAEEKENDKEG